MAVDKKFCFKNNQGEDIYLFTMKNKYGTTVTITNYGAIITSFKIKMANGSFNDIVLGFDNVGDYLSENYLKHYAYLGAACGRYANRIKNGKFILDGKEYQLTQNMGNDILHGGKEGFDKKVWDPVLINSASNILELKYTSKDGEEGFPGDLETIAVFELSDKNELSYEFMAIADRSTVVNLTHHSYFNLNSGKGAILEHEVRVPSSNILKQDEGLVCNGEYVPVENTKYDFRQFKKIGQEYDQCFIVDNKNDELSLVAEAKSLQSGIAIQIFSTEPAVQLYTGQGLNIKNGKDGIDYVPFSGFCLETHKHPNAINIPHFPNTVLRPGQRYYQNNLYKVIQVEAK